MVRVHRALVEKRQEAKVAKPAKVQPKPKATGTMPGSIANAKQAKVMASTLAKASDNGAKLDRLLNLVERVIEENEELRAEIKELKAMFED